MPDVQTLSTSPRLYIVDNFATDAEINHILKLADDAQALAALGLAAKHDDTGFSFEMPVADIVLLGLVQRINDLVRMKNMLSETVRFRRYSVGEYHPAHLDTYQIDQWTLILTTILYLTDTEEGGETHFSKAEPAPVSIAPKRGRLGIWFNHTPDGRVEPASIHEALPVKKGVKATITYFFYQTLDYCRVEIS